MDDFKVCRLFFQIKESLKSSGGRFSQFARKQYGLNLPKYFLVMSC